jgi:hypothetical protein
MNIYLCDSPAGSIDEPDGHWMWSAGNYKNYTLQDLDNPSHTYNPEPGKIGSGYDWDSTGKWYVFKGVKGPRFSLTSNGEKVPSVFEEITFKKPDKEQ